MIVGLATRGSKTWGEVVERLIREVFGSSEFFGVVILFYFFLFFSFLPCYIMRQDYYNKEQFEYFKTIMSDRRARVLHLDVVS